MFKERGGGGQGAGARENWEWGYRRWETRYVRRQDFKGGVKQKKLNTYKGAKTRNKGYWNSAVARVK